VEIDRINEAAATPARKVPYLSEYSNDKRIVKKEEAIHFYSGLFFST